MTYDERIRFQAALTTVFRPGAPVDSKDLFTGREKQVDAVINATFQHGQHIVMFGERGVGKTSLARTLADLLKSAGVTPLSSGTINCDGSDDFSKLWHKVFRELQLVVKTQVAGFSPQTQELPINFDNLLPDSVTPDDVRFAINQAVALAAPKTRMIVIFDEVDRIATKEVTTMLADTIKNLSDHVVPVTIILVGVADAVDQLITGHLSIERCLVQVPMPRMSPAELESVIATGLQHVGMTMENDAKFLIVGLSQGLPHFTHLLALESALDAIKEDTANISKSNVLKATKNAVENSHSLLSTYYAATNSPQRNTLFEKVLLACALAAKDELGWFSSTDVAQSLSLIMEKEYSVPYFARHLSEFSSGKRGMLLQKYPQKRQHKYRFSNPLMAPFTIIKALSTGLLDHPTAGIPLQQRPDSASTD